MLWIILKVSKFKQMGVFADGLKSTLCRGNTCESSCYKMLKLYTTHFLIGVINHEG